MSKNIRNFIVAPELALLLRRAAVDGGGGAGVWGSITGTLASQSDLQSALNAKADTGHNHSGTYQPADTQLTDIAGLAYASNALKVIRVNAGETAFELATPTGGSGTGNSYFPSGWG